LRPKRHTHEARRRTKARQADHSAAASAPLRCRRSWSPAGPDRQQHHPPASPARLQQHPTFRRSPAGPGQQAVKGDGGIAPTVRGQRQACQGAVDAIEPPRCRSSPREQAAGAPQAGDAGGAQHPDADIVRLTRPPASPRPPAATHALTHHPIS